MSFSDVIVISDSDDEANPLPPSSSQFSQQSFDSDMVDLCSSDDELPAPGGAKFLAALAQKTRNRDSTTATSCRSSSIEYSFQDRYSSEEEGSPKKVVKTNSDEGFKKPARRPRKTEEEKALAKELKQQAAARKKQEKADEKKRKDAQKAADKEAKKEYKSANKLVNDKKMTLKDMHLVLPPTFQDSELHRALRVKLSEFDMRITIADIRIARGYDVLSWRRHMTAEYDPDAREWLATGPYEKTESTYLVYLKADELARCIRDEDGVKNVVRQVRASYGLAGSPHQIFILIDGLTLYLRRKTGIRYTKGEIERAMAALQMAEHAHLLYVDKVEEAVDRLYDLSADLGIKPYKLIERSHLPFCADTHQPTGTDMTDTWTKMLKQVYKMPDSGAHGIADKFPTARALFENYSVYEGHPEAQSRLVMHCVISHLADGTAKGRDVGKALSHKVGTVMYGRDPLELVVKGTV
ncbi:hypothetical protein B0H10DRAFT_1997937 [Mycena sp. CBHHK59/15]|nr:hypothetical protein B0H10DRAFT_1997937 [Mycena sp. CBHHK59/15]